MSDTRNRVVDRTEAIGANWAGVCFRTRELVERALETVAVQLESLYVRRLAVKDRLAQLRDTYR